METLGKRIKHCRKSLNLSQLEFADKVQVGSVGAVSNWEKDKRIPDVNTLTIISKLACVSLDWLITGVGTPPGQKTLKEEISQEMLKNEEQKTALEREAEALGFSEDEINLIRDIRTTGSKEQFKEILALKKKTQKAIYKLINDNSEDCKNASAPDQKKEEGYSLEGGKG